MTPTATSPDGRIRFWNCDCMTVMQQHKGWELSICDPEYGIDAGNMTMGSGKNKKYNKSDWDKKTPDKAYFDELFKVSENQIVCGGNYFTDKLPISKGWIFWDKGINGDCSFADGELFWTSFDTVLRIAPIRYKGFLVADKDRIHITQKPIALYRWLLQNYAKKGDRIFDSHGGSMSSAIACDMEGYELDICEIDKDYFDAGYARFMDYYTKKTEIAELGYARTALSKIHPLLF